MLGGIECASAGCAPEYRCDQRVLTAGRIVGTNHARAKQTPLSPAPCLPGASGTGLPAAARFGLPARVSLGHSKRPNGEALPIEDVGECGICREVSVKITEARA
jgi:hypothetical protein